ncbi:MAG: hypothetical protein AB1798_02795 [Spirochaetota bacterium]
MMDCDAIKLKMQALTDHELAESEIPAVIGHLESCYKCRDEYISLLKLQRRMKGLSVPEPQPEWFEALPGKVLRKTTALAGKILFFGSYLLLLGYAVFSLFIDKSADLFIKIAIGALLGGIVVLLGVSIADRIRESKNDRYKGVLK